MAGRRHLKKAEVIAALRVARGLVRPASERLQCDDKTVRNWIARDPDVAAVLEEEREALLDHTETALFKAIERGEPWAIPFTLRTIGRKRGYTERTELTGPDGSHLVLTWGPTIAGPPAIPAHSGVPADGGSGRTNREIAPSDAAEPPDVATAGSG